MLLTSLQQSQTLLICITFILGLMVGSFLNVLIYRLPVMMQRNWRKECREYLELPAIDEGEAFNLVFPGSRCPHCKNAIKPYQNIPVISFLLLRGKCGHCAAPISWRYPLIETFTGVCSALAAWKFGYGPAMLCALPLTWCLIALSFIDIDQHLLPDSITQPLLWSGLLLSLWSIYTDSYASIVGAVAGYLSLWSVYWIFKLITGKEGMGYGDFKLLSVFGAWLGWQYLPLIIMLSSLVGALIGVTMIIFRNHDARKPIPFGPYLAAAGWLALIWGQDLNRLYLNAAGF